MQDRPPPLPADFFEQEKPPPLPADFFAPKPDPAKRIAQGKPKSQVKRENVLQTSNIGALIGARFGAKPINPNQRKANELAKITGKTVAPATTVTGVKNPKPKAASGMDLANMANELQERMSKALKPIDPPDWVPNPLLGALGFVPGGKEVAKPSNVISGVALGGVDVAGDVAAFADRNSTREQQLGALANILVKTPLAVAGGGLALKGVSKGVQLAITKAQKVGSQRAMLAALKAAEKEGADLGQFATQVIPPKVETPSGLPPNLQPKPAAKPVVEAKGANPVKNAGTGKPFSGKVYHGSGEVFDQFSPEKMGANTGAESAKKALFFTDDGDAASAYAAMAADKINAKKRLAELAEWDKTHQPEIERLYAEGKGYEAMGLEGSRPHSPMSPQWDSDPARKAGSNVRIQDVSLENPLVVDFNGGPRGEKFSEILDRAKAAGHDGVIFKNVYDDPIGKRPINVIAKFSDSVEGKSPTPPTPPKGAKEAWEMTRAEVEKSPLVRVVGRDFDSEFLHGTRTANIRTLMADAPKGAKRKATGNPMLDAIAPPVQNEFGADILLSEARQPQQAVMFGSGKGEAVARVSLKPGTRLLDLSDEISRAPKIAFGNEPSIVRVFRRPAITDDFIKWYEDKISEGYKARNPNWRTTQLVSIDPASPNFDPAGFAAKLGEYARDRGYDGIRLADETVLLNRKAIASVKKAGADEVESLRNTRAYPGSRFGSLFTDKPTGAYAESHKIRVESALKEGKLTPERARELGHFEAYPDLAAKYGGKAEAPKPASKPTPKPLESIGGPGKLPEGPKKLTGEIPKPTVKENLTVPKAEVPKVEEPKVAIPKDPTPASGLARRFRDPEQVAAGKEVTPAVPKNAKGLAEKGRKLYEQGKNPDEILERVAKNGERPSYDVDVPVIEHYKQIVRSEKATLIKARAKAKPQELPEIDTAIALLDGKSDEIEAFAQKAATEFHGMGEALQIAHNTESMAFVDIREQARALNLGEKLHPKMEKQLESLSKKYEDAMGQIEELKNQIQLKAVAFRGSSARRRSSALERIRGLGIETVDAPAPASPMKSKQSGAIKLPEFGTPREQLRRAVTELSSVYIKEGAKDIDEVLRRLSEDVPGLGRDDFLSLLSPAVRKYRTEAMVAAGQTRKVMSKVRAAAEFRTKSIAGKGFTIAADLGKNVKRNIQASYDLSAALLQGKPALLARPGSWLKSWDAAAKVLAPTAKDASGKVKWQGADEAAQRAYANIIQEPAIKEAVDQGWLKLRSPHGTFSPQEEIFRGEIAHIIPGVARSDAVFGSQLNAIYGDWYRKLAGLMPDNAEYKQSIGAIMNMLSGRGHGDFADVALSHPGVGWLGYAPKYAYSLAQVGTGAPVWFKGLHPKARIEAAKIYASGLATVYMVNKAAPLFGFEVDNDPRSVNFGTLEKDGKQYDAYNQLTQFPRMLLQMFYGKIGERGQYKNPGDWGFEPMMDYVHNKFSPFLRDIEIMSTGKMWDAGEGKMKTVTKEDLAWTFAPLAIQDIRRLEDKSGTSVALGVMGGRPKEAKAKDLKSGEKRAPDFDPMPPGLKRMLDGTE